MCVTEIDVLDAVAGRNLTMLDAPILVIDRAVRADLQLARIPATLVIHLDYEAAVGMKMFSLEPDLALDVIALRDAAGRVHQLDTLAFHRRHALQREFRMADDGAFRSEEHTSELQSRQYIVSRLLL